MGALIEVTQELQGIRREAEALAEVLENGGDTFDGEEIAAMLRCIVNGFTARKVCQDFEIEDDI